MLEKMDAFFEARLEGYDAHMLNNIQGAGEFYPFTADCLPLREAARILDLGCGTGLELEYYFARNPSARVAGIDLSQRMLGVLRAKFPDKSLELVQGSYFDVPFGVELYDAAVSVESLHHFTRDEKTALYRKLREALKPGGYLILTDYFAADDREEQFFRSELLRLKGEAGITDGGLYHYDIPLTVENETGALLDGGFHKVKVLRSWGATSILWAGK